MVTCVTPGSEPVVRAGEPRAGTHLNMLGADGPGKAEAELEVVSAAELFCDEWQQASHGGELTGAVERGLVSRDDVTELGEVLTGAAPGRGSDDAVTLFDSTGLAIQDLAICQALVEAHAAGAVQVGMRPSLTVSVPLTGSAGPTVRTYAVSPDGETPRSLGPGARRARARDHRARRRTGRRRRPGAAGRWRPARGQRLGRPAARRR